MATTASRMVSAPGGMAWRTRDIVVTAIIGVVFGVVFQVWNVVAQSASGLFTAFPAAGNLLYGVWLMPAVLAPLIVRKPGAALFAEVVAAGLSLFLGSPYGADALLSGVVQGAGAELVFLVFRYRVWSIPVLALAAAASATAAWAHDWIVWYAAIGLDVQIWYWVFAVLSAVVIAAGGSVLLVRALRQADVLKGFPAG
jgi:energy-coupling factor transport system substrate-specific component